MTKIYFKSPAPFAKTTKKQKITVFILNSAELKSWLKKETKSLQAQVKQAGFEAKPSQVLVIMNKDAQPDSILIGVKSPMHYLDTAVLSQHIQSNFSKSFMDDHVFEIQSKHNEEDMTKACIGWGLAGYSFDTYKDNKKHAPTLLWPAKANQKEAKATIEAISLIRNLINTPAHDLGTNELADVAKNLAKTHKATVKVIKGDEKLKKDFPMIYHVGKASPRPPQLVDIKWGNKKHPKVTIVGKGIIYDTGGLNIKTGVGMRYMKKDMGGAAHALAVGSMIMALKLPVQLRVILPIAENAVAGNSYRPGDVLPTRKGISVEIDDTDAEGRLVLADALTYASEDKPDLLIDFATLTGAARVAIGYDVPAFFSNRDEHIDTLRHLSLKKDDFIWPFPLWDGYDGNINGSISDVISVGSGRAGHIEAALFLQRFITSDIDWVHLDCFAWEQKEKAGRTQGGADTGARAIFNFIRERYA